MANSSGVLTRAAVKRPVAVNPTYGTAAGSMTNQIPLISESMTNAITFDEEDSVVGSAGKAGTEIVAEHPSGTITTDLWYESLEYLFYAAFGFLNPSVRTTAYGTTGVTGDMGSPAPDVFATPRAWHNLYELDDTLHIAPWAVGERLASSGSVGDAANWDATHRKVRSFDLLIDKGEPSGYYWRFINCMVNSMTIRASLEGVTAEWGLTAYKQDTLATGSGGTWALPALGLYSKERAVFPHLTVCLSATGSQPTAIAVKEFTLTLTNPLDEAWCSGTASKYKIEPVRSAPRTVRGTIKLARYTADTFPAALRAKTGLALDVKFASPNTITTAAGNASTQGWKNTIQFCAPLVYITKADFPVTGPGIIEGDIEFECVSNLTSATMVPAWITGTGKIADDIDVKKVGELLLATRNSRPYCFSRDYYTGAPGGIALP